MRQIVLILPLLVGCRSCEERRAARAEEAALEELRPALEIDTLFITAAQVEREDGGVEAWSSEGTSVEIRAPEEWDLAVYVEAPAWTYELEDGDCPDDVPLTWKTGFGDLTAFVEAGRGLSWTTIGGGCDLSGDDISGTYEAGYNVDVYACEAGAGCDASRGYHLSVAVEVTLTIE